MKRLTLLITLSLLLFGCNALKDMQRMFERQERANTFVKEKYGWDVQLGFHMNNTTLTQVTLSLNSKDVGDKKFSELELIAREVVKRSSKRSHNT